jgi:hypothetical protein
MVLSDAQKSKLKKHMDAYKGTATDKKSHKGKMMRRMEKGMSVKKAMDDIGKSTFAAKNKGKKNAKNPIDRQLLRDAVNEYNQGQTPDRRVVIAPEVPNSGSGTRQFSGGAGHVLITLANGQEAHRYLIGRSGGLPVTAPQRDAILNLARDIAIEQEGLPLTPPEIQAQEGG